MVGGDALGGVSEGQGVQEDGSSQVGMDRELAGEVLQVQFLGDGRVVSGDGGDVGLEGRGVFALSQPGGDLLADPAEARVDVMGMDGQGVGRPVSPEDVHRAGQEPQHAPGSLEGAQRRELLGEDGERFGMERVAATEQVPHLGAQSHRAGSSL